MRFFFIIAFVFILGLMIFAFEPKATAPLKEITSETRKSQSFRKLADNRLSSRILNSSRDFRLNSLENPIIENFSLSKDEYLSSAIERLIQVYEEVYPETGELSYEIEGDSDVLIPVRFSDKLFHSVLFLTAALVGKDVYHHEGVLSFRDLDESTIAIQSSSFKTGMRDQLRFLVQPPITITESRIEMPVFLPQKNEVEVKFDFDEEFEGFVNDGSLISQCCHLGPILIKAGLLEDDESISFFDDGERSIMNLSASPENTARISAIVNVLEHD